MKTIYVLVADDAWAKLYRFSCQPEQLGLIYHQRNLPNQASTKHVMHNNAAQHVSSALTEEEEFARSLCKILQLDCQAGLFDGLVVISSGEFLAMIVQHLGSECRERMLDGIAQRPQQLSEQHLLVTVRDLIKQQGQSRASALL